MTESQYVNPPAAGIADIGDDLIVSLAPQPSAVASQTDAAR
jgi:hypothetical protein